MYAYIFDLKVLFFIRLRLQSSVWGWFHCSFTHMRVLFAVLPPNTNPLASALKLSAVLAPASSQQDSDPSAFDHLEPVNARAPSEDSEESEVMNRIQCPPLLAE